MKITKVGSIPSERIWVGKCSECKSEAEATENELTNIESGDRCTVFSWETCPVCKAEGYGAMCFYPKDELL